MFAVGHKMVAIIYTHHSVISVGVPKTISRLYIKGRRYDVPSIHAEIDAVVRLINLDCHVKANMFVMKRNYGLSKPCHDCIEMLRKMRQVKIKRVICWTERGMTTIRFNDLTNDHMSRGWSRWHAGSFA